MPDTSVWDVPMRFIVLQYWIRHSPNLMKATYGDSEDRKYDEVEVILWAQRNLHWSHICDIAELVSPPIVHNDGWRMGVKEIVTR